MPESLNILIDRVEIRLGGKIIVRDASAFVRGGDSVALIGVSGCGKTTLLRAMAGLSELSHGEILIGGVPPARLYSTRSLAFLFQEPFLWDHLTVEQTLQLAYQLHNLIPDLEYIRQLLESLGLWDSRHLYPYKLSVGMKARLAMGRAFCVPPRVLLADEPFASLDPIRRLKLNKELRSMRAKCGCTTIFVTHDIVEAMQFANRIIVLGGRPASVLKHYDMSKLPRIKDPAHLPDECLTLRNEILELLVHDGGYS